MPRHALWETSDVRLKRVEALHQRAVEARAPQAATRGSLWGDLSILFQIEKMKIIEQLRLGSHRFNLPHSRSRYMFVP